MAERVGGGAGHSGIFALATGGGGAIAILRLSGSLVAPALVALCGRVPPPRRASLRPLRDGAGEVLDRAMVLWMPGPRSYTGEDCAELQVHGGHAVIEAVSAALVACGLRPAEPGEFSRIAFLNGQMDLLEAEGVADLVAAETEAQRRQALRQLQGEASRLYAEWAEVLRRQLAAQEALVDFPDEDLPPSVEAAMLHDIATLLATLRGHLAEGAAAERVRDGVVVAITGAPNVGKSSLFNRLSGHPAAIVAAEPGTTRDVVSSRMVIAGVPVTLLDTAGLREGAGEIEREGIRRARAAAASADIVLHVVAPGGDDAISVAADLVVANKIDLGDPDPRATVGCSALSGQGFDALRDWLDQAVARQVRLSGPAVLTRARHRAAMAEAAVHLGDAEAATLAELRAESLRSAYLALGRVTGIGDVETILDEVFGRFCIGK